MPTFEKVQPPQQGERITVSNGQLVIPEQPIIPFIAGDGIGPDITRAMRPVVDAAVKQAYGGKRKIVWFEVFAGQSGYDRYGSWLPDDTLKAIEHYIVSIKGPLTTPIGGGIRSLNVSLRQTFELYACVRPVRHFPGVPAPVKRPDKIDMVVFRENTEDVYAGIEWPAYSPETRKLIDFLKKEMGVTVRPDSGIGIKPISETGSKRLARKAIRYAIERHRESITLVHKGNIMKYTEGAFREWGYQVAREEFPDQTVTWDDLQTNYGGTKPADKILVKDEIADITFQKVLNRSDEYDVLVTPNLNGDYLSDALAAQVGGVGMAPGANIGDYLALFEATHGTAPKYTNLDVVNPSSLILSAVMMLEYMGWQEAADLIVTGMTEAIAQKTVTYDLERQMEGATKVKCSEFGQRIISNMTT